MVSKRYEDSLRVALKYGVRVTFCGSIDDQLVSMEVRFFVLLIEYYINFFLVFHFLYCKPSLYLQSSLRRWPHSCTKFHIPLNRLRLEAPKPWRIRSWFDT